MKEMKLLAEWSYSPAKITRGYSRETLYVNLGNKDGKYEFKTRPVSQQMIDTFIGGRGFGLKILWDGVKPTTKWDDPENEIVISGGPVCGTTQYPGGERATPYFSPL